MARKNPVVTFTLENGNAFKAELYPDQAPNTVNNFISLVKKKFYDGLTFHRVIPGFVIQGGCPEGTGTGGPGYSIRGEFLRDPKQRDSFMPHTRGMLSMARAQDPDSAGSQFFVMVADVPHLNGQYATFGKVLEGMEFVDAIVASPVDQRDCPKTPQRMATVVVDTFGETYPQPKTL
ncbi:MAG: peptidylprolyl isomerase [Deltaproteobacteria bacterium]|nr:peptidylprolyl isomerase [Deltaproteobacteria bacterium]